MRAMPIDFSISSALACVLSMFIATHAIGSPGVGGELLGEARQHDAAGSVQTIRMKAHGGDASAQFVLAQLLHQGAHMRRDLFEARRWYQAAAKQNYVEAQFLLGVMHDNGEGGRSDKQAAVTWYKRAAALGHSGAQVNLAVSYLRGEGVEEDEAKAKMLLEKATEQDDSRAFFGLALIHEQGRGVPIDLCHAISLYRQSPRLIH